jgi:hypothetical protein
MVKQLTLKKLYNKNKSEIIFEFILNHWLLINNYRNMYQIYRLNNKDFELIEKICIKNNIKYIIFHNRLIIFNDSIDITKIDFSFKKKFAKQLGEFYISPTNNLNKLKKEKNSKRLIIKCSNKKYTADLYAQICSENKLINNIKKILLILNQLKKLLLIFDSKLKIDLLIESQIFF